MNQQVLLNDGWYWVLDKDEDCLWVIKESDPDLDRKVFTKDCLSFRNKTR